MNHICLLFVDWMKTWHEKLQELRINESSLWYLFMFRTYIFYSKNFAASNNTVVLIKYFYAVQIGINIRNVIV